MDQSSGENIKGSDSGDETMEDENRKEARTPLLHLRTWNAGDGPTRSLERHQVVVPTVAKASPTDAELG